MSRASSVVSTLIAANTTKNVGPADRAVRALLPFVVGGLWWAGVLPAVVAVPVLVVAALLFPTAFTGACSIYYFLGFSTCPVSGRSAPVPTSAASAHLRR